MIGSAPNTPPSRKANGTSGHHLVAVPDLDASEENGTLGPRYRLGVQSDGASSTYRIGQEPPPGDNPKNEFVALEMVSAVARYEIDFEAGKLTVAVHEGTDQVQATVYEIDVEAMSGQPVRAGESVEIVFSYDGQLTTDNTAAIERWMAVTRPRFREELLHKVGSKSADVVDMQQAIRGAARRGRYFSAPGAPLTVRPFVGPSWDQSHEDAVEVDLRTSSVPAATNGTTIDLTDGGTGTATPAIEADRGSTEVPTRTQVLVADPRHYVSYLGEQIVDPQGVTLEEIRDDKMNAVFLRLDNGGSATIAVQAEVPLVQLSDRGEQIEGPLGKDTWSTRISLDEPLMLSIVTDDGERTVRTSRVIRIVATGPALSPDRRRTLIDEGIPQDDAIAYHRSVTTNGRPLTHGRGGRHDHGPEVRSGERRGLGRSIA